MKPANGFKRGISGNPSGKLPGTLNKTTKDIKEAYRLLIENNLPNLEKWLVQIAEKDPEKAIKLLSELSEYVIPKLARTDLTSGDKPLQPVLNITVDSSETAEEFKRMKDELSKID